MQFKTIDDLLKKTDEIIGKSINDIIKENDSSDIKLKSNKGILGNYIETEFYHYPNNSISKADFEELGVELKTSGMIYNKKGELRSKERLVLGMIDYYQIINETFENSHLMKKNENILILWYLYQKGVNKFDFKFQEYLLHSLLQDKDIIKRDYEIIQNKIKKGLAHELSEGDTTYLGACTKAANSKIRRNQPNSDIRAKPRAFSLKNKYMNAILWNHLNNKKIVKKEHKIINVTDYIKDLLKPYFGKTQLEIINIRSKDENSYFHNKNLSKLPKNLNKLISDDIIGKDKELYELDDIFKNSIYFIKNVPIFSDFKLKERMTFKNLKISDFQEEWDNSEWKSYFEQVTLIVICYELKEKTTKHGYRILKDVKKVSFTDDDLKSISIAYNKIKYALDMYEITNGMYSMDEYIKLLPTPKTYENQIIELVPKQSKGKNSYKNFFNEGNSTKSAFALTKEFLQNKLINSVS